MIIRLSAIFAAILGFAAAIPVDNGVEGDPEIECGPTAITINFNTQNPFEGHVYVKGLYATPGCRNDEGGRQVAGITLPFDTCGVSRARSLNPRGVFVSTTVIISFHPLFVTKVDRAYRIQCFYMEADKTVDTDLEVSVLTTGFQSQQVPMPVCRYEILEGGPTGPFVLFALVGQQVYHKWTCDTETVDTFCMIVHSCYVDDNNGDRVDLIGTDGCATDIYLLNNPEYLSDLMAGVEAHVFKYADRPQLYFQCQITIVVKEPNQDCPRPSCAAPPGRGGPRPAGPQPPPPANPFPLVQGSPYLPRPGDGPVVHGPGDPAAPFAPGRGRPDPNTYHQAGPRSGPQGRARGQGQRPQPQGRRPFQPASRSNSRQQFGQRPLPFGGRAPFARRPFDAPAVDTKESHEEEAREKRQVENFDNLAGTMDVNVGISALDIDDSYKGLPKELQERLPVLSYNPVTIMQDTQDGICLSPTGFAVFLTLSIGLILAIATASTCMMLRRGKH